MRKWIIGIIVVLAVMLFFIFIQHNERSKNKSKASPPQASVRVVAEKVCQQAVPMLVSVMGNVITQDQAVLRAKQAGYITQIDFNEGAHVKKGQVLISLDNRIQLADLQQKKIDLKQKLTTYTRNKKAAESGGVAAEDLDSKLVAYQNAQNAVRQARITLSDMQIRAPFDGVVGQKNLSIGQYITPQSDLVSMVGANNFRVSYQLPSRYQRDAKVGQTVSVAIGGHKYPAKVSFVSDQLDIGSQTFAVTALFDQADPSFKSGQWVQLTQQIGSNAHAILVPGLSVQTQIGSYYVFVVKNGKVEQVNVTLGDRIGSKVVIASGLKDGQTIVTEGADQLHQGTPIIVSKTHTDRCS